MLQTLHCSNKILMQSANQYCSNSDKYWWYNACIICSLTIYTGTTAIAVPFIDIITCRWREIHVITDTAWQINMYCTVLLLYHIIVFIEGGVPIGTFCPEPYTYRGPKFQTTLKNLTSTFHSPIITSTWGGGPPSKYFAPGLADTTLAALYRGIT